MENKQEAFGAPAELQQHDVPGTAEAWGTSHRFMPQNEVPQRVECGQRTARRRQPSVGLRRAPYSSGIYF